MNFKSWRDGRVYILRWTANPGPGDATTILGEVESARRAAGRPILYLAVIDPAIGMPGANARDEFNKHLGAMSAACDAIDCAILGSDFRATLVRTLVRAMSLASRDKKMRVFSGIEEAFTDWGQRFGENRAALLGRYQQSERNAVSA